MKIGIVGSGNMGRSLGILWAEQGHEVFFGSGDAEKRKATPNFEFKLNQINLNKLTQL